MNNKISIVIPAYNIESYLGKTLDSVLAQTYKNIEIIVVNDGSNDGTADIINTYASKDDRILAIHKENGGVISARLRGVEAATGEWIGFVDGDDYVEPQMFSELLDNALIHGADISHCGYQMVFPNGRVDYYYNTGRLIKQEGVDGVKGLVSGTIEPGIWNKLYHKTLFFGLDKKMDFTIKINEDMLMNYWLFRSAKSSVYKDICPYHYVLRKGSAATSQLNENKLLDPIRVTKVLLDDADPKFHSILLRKLGRQLIKLATMSTKQQPELIDPHRKAARQELRSRFAEIWEAGIGTKMRVLLIWSAVSPGSYGWVHEQYTKITGLDEKYNLD